MDVCGTVPSDGERKVVQTTLDKRDYERFRRLAEADGITLKAALRTAVREYVEEKESVDDDLLFVALDSLDETAGKSTDAREMDADLYGP